MLVLVECLAECLVLCGEVADPGAGFGERAVASGAGGRDWFSGAQRVDLLVWVAAAQFGIGGDGQVAGRGGDVFPVLPVGHGLGQALFPLPVQVTQGPVGAGQSLLPPGAVLVAGLAGNISFGVGADGAQAGVEAAEPGSP